MKLFQETIPLIHDSAYIIREFNVDCLTFPIHTHPEYELIHINGGDGFRIIGDHKANFENGDLVFVGPNLPHIWRTIDNSGSPIIRELILQINQHFPGNDFLAFPECKLLKDLYQKSTRGIRFYGQTAVAGGGMLNELLNKSYMEGVIYMMQLLSFLSQSNEFELLSSEIFAKNGLVEEEDSFSPFYNYLKNNFKEDISINAIANEMNMSVSALSHFIKKKTAKSFTVLLIEMRLGEACRLLIETNKTVLQICYDCGFGNLSYFNRKFKEFKSMTPNQFRVFFQGKNVFNI